MKKSIAFILILLPHLLFSQVKITQNSPVAYKNEVGLELGGNGLIYSLYYQRTIAEKDNVQFNIKTGGSLYPKFAEKNNPSIGIYIVPNILIFHKRHAWEIGIGFNNLTEFKGHYFHYNYSSNTGIWRKDNTYLYFLTPQFAYRAYLKDSQFYVKPMASLFILAGVHESNESYTDVEPKALPWVGFSLGYAFGKK